MLRTFLLSIILLSSVLVFSQKKTGDNKPDQWDTYVENWMQKDSVPGVFLTIAKEGKVLKEKGYGYANLELKSIPQSNTVYEVAAITQMFTATAICMLSEQKKLNLDSSILKYIPSLPKGWRLATIRNLLYHCHGLNPQHYDENLLYSPPNHRYTVTDQLQYYWAQRQHAIAGTASYYSNAAFFLLGVIIQNVSGMTYNEFIKKNIFDKAGMKNSSFIDAQAIVPNRAQGYTLRKGKWIRWMLEQNIQSLDCNSFTGILSTAEDLLKFDDALRNYIFIKKETTKQMLEPFILSDGKPAASGRSNWGMGFLVKDINGYQCVYHLGITGTAFFRFPKEGLSVIIFTNLGDGGDFVKDKGTNMQENGLKLAEQAVTEYLLKK